MTHDSVSPRLNQSNAAFGTPDPKREPFLCSLTPFIFAITSQDIPC